MTVVDHRDLVLATLGTGSSGNCTYVGTERVGVLIDAGVSARATVTRLEAAGLGSARIAAILLTHEHSDHIGAADRVARHLERRQGAWPEILCTRGTGLNLPNELPYRAVRHGDQLTIGPLGVAVHGVPHDAREPVCFTVEHAGVRAGVITDLGGVPRSIVGVLASLDLAVLEFNHDLQRLADGPYPPRLQARIRGARGHLDNDAAAVALGSAGGRLQHLVLGHLSTDNNTPELALTAALRAVRDSNAGLQVHVGERYAHNGPFRAAPRVFAAPTPDRQPARPVQLSLF